MVINEKKTLCESINVKNPESQEYLIIHHLELFLFISFIHSCLSVKAKAVSVLLVNR